MERKVGKLAAFEGSEAGERFRDGDTAKSIVSFVNKTAFQHISND